MLRDADGNGHAEVKIVFLSGLISPFGMALIGNDRFIANADAVVQVSYTPGQTHIDAAPIKVTDLPAGINHHCTKNLLARAEGSKLYVTVGFNGNVGENGLEGRAATWDWKSPVVRNACSPAACATTPSPQTTPSAHMSRR